MRLFSFIETGITRLLQLIYAHRIKAVIVLLVAFMGYAVANMPNIQKDGRVEAFMHKDDPALEAYYEMRREFGQDNRLVIAVSGSDVFDADFLIKFSTMHQEIADTVPYISEIFSPYNIPFIEHENGGVYLEELVRNMLLRGRDPAELRDRILETPLYQNFIVSKDGKTASIIIEPYRYAPNSNDCTPNPSEGLTCAIKFTPLSERALLGAPEYTEMTAAAQTVIDKYASKDFEIYMAGAPVVSTEIVKMMGTDMPRFTLACVIITVLTMLFMHRSLLIGLGAFFTFFTSIISTLSTLSLSGVAMTPPTQLLIPMTLVVGLCTYIHFTAALLNARSKTSDGLEALKIAVGKSNMPILFTALTTAGGLLGLTVAPLAPIASLGLFGTVSVGFSYFLALIWATLVFRTLPKKFLNKRKSGPGFAARFMAKSAAACAVFPQRALLASGAVVALIMLGMFQLNYSHNSLLWLAKDNTARVSTEFIDSKYNGTVNLEVIITPQGGLDFRDETLLKTVEKTARNAYGAVDIPIGRHTSIISFIEETNQAIHDGDPVELRLPGQEEIWDQLLLLEGQGIDDMKRYVSMDYSQGRVSFQTPWLEAKLYSDVIETIETQFETALGDTATVETTGLIALLAKTSKAVLDSMTTSYLIALLLVAGLMCLALRSVGLGLVSMVPNIAPFAVLLGLMGYMGIPLDTFTVLIGGIITGLIVDDTLHFFFHARENLEKTDDVSKAVTNTMNEIGGALFTTTLVVMLSFAVFMMSSMSNIQAFGLLMVVGAAVALIAEIVVGPAVLALYHKAKVSKRYASNSTLVPNAPA